ncbi:MAG: branched-chain amino acid transaminase [Pseudomonadota bacterium]|nr:branched-chain amino acid transaminase [Pseudomonadota bacterium]
MTFKSGKFIWHNGQVVNWDDAKVHVLSHALHYGSSVFEGIRLYKTSNGPKIFRLTDHIKRLFNSAKIYRMTIPYSESEIVDACKRITTENKLINGAYIRPIAFRGYGEIGLAPKDDHNIDVSIAAWEWGTYLGDDALKDGVEVCVSSWQRVAPNTIPTMAKAGGNYLSSTLISTEAKRLGFDEGIALSTDGKVSEGAGENLFLVKNNEILTPPASSGILTGITRDTVMSLSDKIGLTVKETEINRETLYLADEMFFTGTAAEITPIKSVDRIIVGNGKRGKITKKLQEEFFGLFSGKTADSHNWLESV